MAPCNFRYIGAIPQHGKLDVVGCVCFLFVGLFLASSSSTFVSVGVGVDLSALSRIGFEKIHSFRII